MEILIKYEPELTLNKAFLPSIIKTSIFDRFVMTLLGLWDLEQYQNHKSTREDKLKIITSYFQIFTRKVEKNDVLKVFNTLDSEVQETPSLQRFVEGFRERYPFCQQHLIHYYKTKFTSLSKEYFGIIDPKS